MNEQKTISTERKGHVQIVRMNRPKSLNSITFAMLDELHEALNWADADRSIRAIVLTGCGGHFSAGADITILEDLVRNPFSRIFGPEFHYPLMLDKPLIGAINGACAGVSVVLAMYCDLRLVTPRSRFIPAFGQRGLVLEQGLSLLFQRSIGDGRTRDIMLTGREIYGQEAMEIGLAQRLVDEDRLLDEAVKVADLIAQGASARSLATIKTQLRTDMLEGYLAAVERDIQLLKTALTWGDLAEGVASLRERRPASFG